MNTSGESTAETEIIDTLMKASHEFSDRASREIEPASDAHGQIMEVVPKRPSAAPLIVHVISGKAVQFTIGRGLVFDIHEERGNRGDFLRFIQNVVEAVGHGRVEESFWTMGDDVVRATGTLELARGSIHHISYRSLRRRKGAQEQSVSYEPY